MRRSLNEVEARLSKAAQGAGLPMGLAEDIGRAGRVLHVCGLDGCGAVWAAIRAAPQWPQLPDMRDGSPVFENARIAVCGPSALDLLAAGSEPVRVRLLRPDSVLLMVGMAMATFCAGGIDAEMRFGGADGILVASEMLAAGGTVPASTAEVSLARRRTQSPRGFSDGGIVDGVEVDEETWRQLGTLAAKTCVSASALSSLSGAGAGKIDND